MDDSVIDYQKIEAVLASASATGGDFSLSVDGRRIRGAVKTKNIQVLAHRGDGKDQTIVLEFRLENANTTKE